MYMLCIDQCKSLHAISLTRWDVARHHHTKMSNKFHGTASDRLDNLHVRRGYSKVMAGQQRGTTMLPTWCTISPLPTSDVEAAHSDDHAAQSAQPSPGHTRRGSYMSDSAIPAANTSAVPAAADDPFVVHPPEVSPLQEAWVRGYVYSCVFATTTHYYAHRRWLLALLVLQSSSSFVLEYYEELLRNHLVVTLFLTMLVGAGGNAGNQSAIKVIRGMVCTSRAQNP